MYHAVHHMRTGWISTRGIDYDGAGATMGVCGYYLNGGTADLGGRRWDARFVSTLCAFVYNVSRSSFCCNDAVYDKILPTRNLARSFVDIPAYDRRFSGNAIVFHSYSWFPNRVWLDCHSLFGTGFRDKA